MKGPNYFKPNLKKFVDENYHWILLGIALGIAIYIVDIYFLKMIKFLNGRLTLILIILLGSVSLRLYNINFDDLWYDEILSFWVINHHTKDHQ